MPGLHTNTGAKRAREARAALGLDGVSPVRCIVALAEERAGLPVIVGAMPDEVAGALYRNGLGTIIWGNGRGQSVARQRFTVAHELGHERCGHDGTQVDTFTTMYGEHDPREVQANAFAAALLAPRPGVEAMVDGEPGLEDVVRIAAHFGISTIAALYRLTTLELVGARRAEVLKGEVDEGLHRDVWDYLDPEPIDDVLAGIEELPRISAALAGSSLAALVRGEVTVDDPALREAAAALGR